MRFARRLVWWSRLAAPRSTASRDLPVGYCKTTDYPGDKFICVLVDVEIEPNALIARHTHPGVEWGYLVSGTSTLSVKGPPDRVLKAGDGFQIPLEVPHSVRNGPAKSLAIANYTVENDKPLASPVPE